MDPRFAQFPAALALRTERARLGPMRTPVLLAHPDWETPAPVVLWMHGRTVSKEIDPGRYLRWLRAGIATCAVDLPGHGERFDQALQSPARTLEVIAQMRAEIDGIVAALGGPEFHGVFDLARMGIGGMSAGGMVTLRRLCDPPHGFIAAAVEGTTGSLSELYMSTDPTKAAVRWNVPHDPEAVARMDASKHLERFRPIALLVLHNRLDEVVPWSTQERFVAQLRQHYTNVGAEAEMIEVKTFDRSEAPQEHSGFGRFSHEAKSAQVDFFTRHLKPVPPLAQ